MARQRTQAERDELSDESTESVPEAVADIKLAVNNTEVVFLNDEIEITYSRGWDLAVVQYEKETLFNSFKVRVAIGTDLTAAGEKLCDMMTELQETDLTWARSMTTNRGSLITKIIPNP